MPLARAWRAGGPDAAAIAFAARAATAIVLLFTLSASKRAQYVLPAVVPLALLVAIAVAAFPARVAAAMSATGRWAALAGIAALTGALALPRIDGAEFFVLTPRVLAAAGVFLVGWGTVTAVTSTRRPAVAVVCAACFAPGLGIARRPDRERRWPAPQRRVLTAPACDAGRFSPSSRSRPGWWPAAWWRVTSSGTR